jgi:outer membrane protein OmpA-like peptidoglycan-associated protein
MKLALPLVLVVSLIAACRTALPPEQPVAVSPLTLAEGEWRVIDYLVVVTDASFSMYEERTFPTARALTQSFIASLPEADVRAKRGGNYSAGLVGFGGEGRKSSPLTLLDREALSSTASGLQIMGLPRAYTPLDVVLGEVGDALGSGVAQKRGSAAIVLFSDGHPDSEERAIAAAEGVIAVVPDGVCFHTVHLGSDPAGAAFLTRLSRLTGCGSARDSGGLGSGGALSGFARSVLIDTAPVSLPQVAAPDPCSQVIRLRGARFGFDQDAVSPESAGALNSAVERLKQCRDVSIHVEGHTDSVGPEAYNQGLSARRASAVERYLVEAGIDASRLDAEGLGESRPLTSNDTSEGRTQNRRVELVPR